MFSEIFLDGVFVSADNEDDDDDDDNDDDDDDDDAIAVFLPKVLDNEALSKRLTGEWSVPTGATYTWNHSG